MHVFIFFMIKTNPWTLDRVGTTGILGLVDSSCTQDYTLIPGMIYTLSIKYLIRNR